MPKWETLWFKTSSFQYTNLLTIAKLLIKLYYILVQHFGKDISKKTLLMQFSTESVSDLIEKEAGVSEFILSWKEVD